MRRVSFFQWRLKVELESPQHFKIWFEKFLPKTNQCSSVWRNRENTLNSWCVVQMKRNTWLPVSIKLPFLRYPSKQDAVLFSRSFYFSNRFLFEWRKRIYRHIIYYIKLCSQFSFSTRKYEKKIALEVTHEPHSKIRDTRFFIIQIQSF